ncbi:Poly(glycerophosphate) glycerophosphotransferase family protein [Burkholderia pseudomallei]|nr:Poly(glycerophosphate) glycerophosphotransferase family protein [Burkholderia pseudomallei]
MTVKKKIRFLFQAASHWYCFASVYRAFGNDCRYDVEVVALPFLKNDVQLGEPSWAFLEAQGIPFVHYLQYDTDADAPDVVFLHCPYDETRPPAFHAAALHEHNVRLAYIPYGPDVGGGERNRRFQYGLDTQLLAWRIFARSEAHRMRYARNLPGSAKRVVVTGHPKLDELRGAPADNPFSPLVDGKCVLLWNPHFSVGFPAELRWSTFDRYVNAMCRLAAQRDDVAIIMRPHPNLFHTLMLREPGKRLIATLIAFANRHRNFVIDQSPLYKAAFDASHAMMTDTSSLMYEYLACDKPILHLDCDGGAGLNEEGRQLVRGMSRARAERDIVAFVDDIVRGRDATQALRRRVIAGVLGECDGKNGERVKLAVDRSDLWQSVPAWLDAI